MPNSRVRPANDAWLNILPAEIAQLDANIASGINAVDGGCCAPETPIEIGAGGPDGLILVGPCEIARGGTLTTTSDSSAFATPTLQLGDNDYPELDPANALNVRPIQIAFANACGVPQVTWNVRLETAAFQAYAPSFDVSDGLGQRLARAYLPIRGHQNATITKISVFFRVTTPHTSLPTVMPLLRMLRIDSQGNAVAMTSQAAGADIYGYVSVPTPSNVAAWNNNQLTQELAVSCDQNNLVDAGSYDYVLEIVEEQGLTGYPWQLTFTVPVLCATTTNIAPVGLQTIDGVAVKAGDVVLVKDNDTETDTNGIYTVSAGDWTRVPWLSKGSQFIQGLVVPVADAGETNSLTFWQLQSSITSWTPDDPTTTPITRGTPLVFLPKANVVNPAEGTAFFGHGILWQSAVVTFAQIPDLGPE